MFECDVVIIDSGIPQAIAAYASGVCIGKKNDIVSISQDLYDRVGHGSLVSALIMQSVSINRIFFIRLADKGEESDDTYLIAALEYIKHNVTCKIINISLGIRTGENLNVLSNLCSELIQQGMVIVSAFDNEGCYSYPAAFNDVIGVDCKRGNLQSNQFIYIENSPINILAKGGLQRISNLDGTVVMAEGSSVACAHITSLIATEFNGIVNKSNVLSFLKERASYIVLSHVKSRANNHLFEINKAVVFPVAKETHAFIRFPEMLSFQIKDYYDVRQSGKVGRRLDKVCFGVRQEGKIKDIDNISFDGVDTLIMGHLDELSVLVNKDLKAALIEKAIGDRINIVSFDPLTPYYSLLEKSKIEYYYPIIDQADVIDNSFGKLFKIPKPVIGIFGTSSKQGKFSLQLALKKELERCGYAVGTLGTEPHSLLFGFDAVFPMGYNSTVELSNKEIITYLNKEINNMCINEKEVILTASQAQFIPYYCNNLLEYPSLQYHFVLGTNPDAVVLCINYFDEISYIRNTIMVLSGITDAKVLALVMYPLTYSEDWRGTYTNMRRNITSEEYLRRKEELQNLFQIPVFRLGDESGTREICKRIIDFF